MTRYHLCVVSLMLAGALLMLLNAAAPARAATLPKWPADWQNGKIGRPEVPYSLGVNIHFTKPRPGEVKMLAAAGFRWIRMDFIWSATEKHKGQYNFNAYDGLLAALRPYHIRAIFILDYGNPLYEHGKPPSTPKARRAFCRWVAAAVKHFKGRGIMWEMWNEPNNVSFPGGPVPYDRLAIAVGKTIRRVAPHELYVGPAWAQKPNLNYLKACFKAGDLNYFDAVTIHPYRRGGPESVGPTTYFPLRLLIAHYAPSGRHIPIISGEWGYTSTWYGGNNAIQGMYAARELLVNLSQGIPLSIWYDWHNDGPNPNNGEDRFGLVQYKYRPHQKQVYAPKPAYRAVQTLSRVLNQCHFIRRISVKGNEAAYILLFGGQNKMRIAAWMPNNKKKTIALPLKAGHYNIISELGKTIGHRLVSSGTNSITVPVSGKPIYVVPQ